MIKATMRDTLGWMKEQTIITSSIIELITFVKNYIGSQIDIELDNITKLNDEEEHVINTKDGLRITLVKK
jgi:hypothetical protein